MDANNRIKKSGLKHCGVPQCNQYKSTEVSMHSIPKEVLESHSELKKWAIILKMGKKFPKNFKICSQHFQENDILTSLVHGRKWLVKGRRPSRCLPQSSVPLRKSSCAARENRLKLRSLTVIPSELDNGENVDQAQIYPEVERECCSVAVQCEDIKEDKSVQVNLKMFIDIISLWDNDSKLFTMTGIPTIKILDAMITACKTARPIENCVMDLKSRICLTMHRIKTNCYFVELAVWFQIAESTAKRYFADTIQLLSKVMKCLIHWQSREQNIKSMPKYFKNYSNVRTVLDCTEIRTVTSGCLACRISTYSHYKGTHTLKVLIGVSPSGAINYVSKFATGKSSDKAIFNFTDLLTKLEPGDAVMVDKGFLIADELANAGIEMVRPDFLYERFSKSQVARCTQIASARVHVERRIARIKQMKVFSERICTSIVPYIDEIMTVVCAISNLSTPILKDDKFL